jgi:hypothetical protein
MPESKTIPVYTDRKGVLRVWRDAVGNYGTFCSDHVLAKEMAKEIESLRERIESLRERLGPSVCRLQFPDGSVPGDAAEAANGWKKWADEFEHRAREAAEEIERLRAELAEAKQREP